MRTELEGRRIGNLSEQIRAAARAIDDRVPRDGNWPMLVDVIDLPPAPSGGYYMLWLSRNGKPVAPCGSFNTATANKETVVRLSAAYSFNGINGWIVTREVPGAGHGQVVMTT